MPTLYNPSRTPTPVPLRDGSTTSIPGKGNLFVAEKLFGSTDIARKLQKRQLIRRAGKDVVAAVLPVVAPAPEVASSDHVVGMKAESAAEPEPPPEFPESESGGVEDPTPTLDETPSNKSRRGKSRKASE